MSNRTSFSANTGTTKKGAVGNKKGQDSSLGLSVDEQMSRANAIASMDVDQFIPQSFVSTRQVNPEKQQSKSKELSKETLDFFSGPIENLISPKIMIANEEERNRRIAENLTELRRTFLARRKDGST